ncbi:MAG: NAD(P)-dependent oxidoreductase [Bacillota bacterium]|jgi:3-hydroxyisobutyrate dehydrogenase/2-hydroxy-3-oxopropionate reductase|nr:NAD(P)-dependent oxidoreductase [Bacillota bacterium]HHY08317.1 NAD(P)-dependent oxidoreductase [Mycobacteriales bacterium]
MEKIGFIGVGIMGKGMVRNLMKAGYEVNIFARHPKKVADVVAEGAILHDTIASCVKAADVIITIVGFPKDVEEVYFKEGNILDSAVTGSVLIDMTTTSPTLAERIFAEGTKRGLKVLDAPVTGGDTGAKNGTLSILVGGDESAFEQCLPIFQAMGTTITYFGPAGYGQHAKLANQIMIAGALSGVCEALTYAKKKGLNLTTLFGAVSKGAAGSAQLNAFGPKIISEDYAPGFYLKHLVKDLKLADEEAVAEGLSLNILRQVLREYQELEDKGMGDLGTQALIHYYKSEK